MCNILTISTVDKNILVLLQKKTEMVDVIEIKEENRQAELLVVTVEKLLNKTTWTIYD